MKKRRIRNTQEELINMKKLIIEQNIKRKITRKEASKILEMHPNAFSRLKTRYLKEGISALIPKKPGPKRYRPKNRTPEYITDIVIRTAIHNPDLGPVPLEDKLFEDHRINIDSVTIWRILKREKIRYNTYYRRWKPEPKLYCLNKPGLELQMDGCYPYGRSKNTVVFDAIDDCSRWVYGKVYDRETASNAIDFVRHLIENVPFSIQRIRVDNRYGIEFRRYCESIGIEVIENDPYCPEQNGKIERFHKTLKREFFWKYCNYFDSNELLSFKLKLWLNHYNDERKHSGYGMNGMSPRLKIASTLYQSLYFINYPQNVTLTLQQYIISMI